jgi:hypothetical protein
MKWLEYQFLGTPFQNLCELELRHPGAGEISLCKLIPPTRFHLMSDYATYQACGIQSINIGAFPSMRRSL